MNIKRLFYLLLVTVLSSTTVTSHAQTVNTRPAQRVGSAPDTTRYGQDTQSNKPSLIAGNQAPPIVIGKWVKGEAVNEFKKGQVYVVEFWATWCGPCKVSIPHLTELAEKYKGEATFIGVDVNEVPQPKDTSYFKKVEGFVKQMGAKMDYTVAVDGKEGTMDRTWLKASGESGIPCAYIVNQEGIISWIGHPSELNEPLQKVIDRKYDPKTGIVEKTAGQLKSEADRQKFKDLLQALGDAASKHDGDQALAVIDQITKELPIQAFQFAPAKFAWLSRKDDATAYAYAREVEQGTAPEVQGMLKEYAGWVYYALATYIIDKNRSHLKNRDYGFAVALAQKAVDFEIKNHGPRVDGYKDTLAQARRLLSESK